MSTSKIKKPLQSNNNAITLEESLVELYLSVKIRNQEEVIFS